MQLIGVVDLIGGLAVHARGGRREAYVPVEAVAGEAIAAGDAGALAHAYVNRLGLADLYVADLDAIVRGAAPNEVIGGLAALGATLWLDAGVASADGAREANLAGADRVVVGLETLPSFRRLEEICAAVGGGNVAFSLDLHDGLPTAGAMAVGHVAPDKLAARAAATGAATVIVLDLARVGSGRGVDLTLMARIRGAVPDAVLIAGGGVRDAADIARLADVGCDGALVATALLDGRLTRADVDAARGPVTPA
jgi:phosphoribosylformimino-5-aminoimidazole carboxamide ribotide isomerase